VPRGLPPLPLDLSPGQDRNEISTASPMFSGSSYPTRSTVMLYDETGSGKFNMAACKQEVHISQLVDVIETKFERLYLCFGVKLSNEIKGNVVLLVSLRSHWDLES